MGMIRSSKLLVVFAVVFAVAVDGCKAEVTPAKRVRIFDVTKYGAKGDGKPIYDEDGESINGLKIVRAWIDACQYTKGPTKVLIPKGTFVVAQVYFSGPCKSHVTVELQGSIVPDPDITQFPNHELLNFQQVDGVTLTGPGYIDAKICGPPRRKGSNRDIDFFSLMPLIKFYNATNAVVDGINCANPAAFHVLVVLSRNITIKNVKFDADFLAPQSDTSGVYISNSKQVTVSNSFIRTGDNCIIIAPGSNQVNITGLTCSAGQGISIGADQFDSIAKDLDVKNVTVKNCTFKETTFGVSLFPRPQVHKTRVSNILFEDLLMDKVNHPIVIHQQMPPRHDNKTIQAKVKDVHIKSINGTTTSRVGVTISCNPKLPCEGIKVTDVHLKYVGKSSLRKVPSEISPKCSNPKVLFEGKHDHLSCASSIVKLGI
ncbi:exopolygalacturonase clone GBGE184-like [Silene latifolia]|uniref:exopolygalacturonase clone GBGE184-like n=1 Tax=Silene latifolia TaxID=37657 RepID=UPI003D76BAA2